MLLVFHSELGRRRVIMESGEFAKDVQPRQFSLRRVKPGPFAMGGKSYIKVAGQPMQKAHRALGRGAARGANAPIALRRGHLTTVSCRRRQRPR